MQSTDAGLYLVVSVLGVGCLITCCLVLVLSLSQFMRMKKHVGVVEELKGGIYMERVSWVKGHKKELRVSSKVKEK